MDCASSPPPPNLLHDDVAAQSIKMLGAAEWAAASHQVKNFPKVLHFQLRHLCRAGGVTREGERKGVFL